MAENPDAVVDEALVAYVRGRLPEAEAARIAALAAERPALAAEIALARGIVADVDAEAAGAGPGALGWARIERVLNAEAAPRPGQRVRSGRWPRPQRRRCSSGRWRRCRCCRGRSPVTCR